MSSSISDLSSSSVSSLFGTSSSDSTSSSSSSSGSRSSSSSSYTTTSQRFNADGSITTLVKDATGDILSETTTGGSSGSDSALSDTNLLDTYA
ncbi:MAG: hypothetical protein ABF705_05815 [Acetobacter syzygii]